MSADARAARLHAQLGSAPLTRAAPRRAARRQDRGVDFPVRPAAEGGDGGAPYYSPPPMPAAAAAAAQGISPEDRAAIAAAVADLEATAAAQQARESALAPPGLPSAGHVPALMGPAVLMGAPIRPPGYAPPPGARGGAAARAARLCRAGSRRAR